VNWLWKMLYPNAYGAQSSIQSAPLPPPGGLLSPSGPGPSIPYGGGDYYGDDSPATPEATAKGIAMADQALNEGSGKDWAKYATNAGLDLLSSATAPMAGMAAPMMQAPPPMMQAPPPSGMHAPQGLLSVNPFADAQPHQAMRRRRPPGMPG